MYKAIISGVVRTSKGSDLVVEIHERIHGDDHTVIFDDIESDIEDFFVGFEGTEKYFIIGATAEYEVYGYEYLECDIVYVIEELDSLSDIKEFIEKEF